MHFRLFYLVVLMLCFQVSFAQKETLFEVGFHYGPVFAQGKVKEFAKNGNSFSLELNANNGHFAFGTEFTFTTWSDFHDDPKARDLNFRKDNFLWLTHVKGYLGEGDVKPYVGLGVDLITLAIGILEGDHECDWDCYHDPEERKYNAWLAPSLGVRWKMGSDLQGNVGFSINTSDNYTFLRLQVGIVF